MRVLAWPAFKNRHANPYNWLLYSNLRELSVEIEEFSLRRMWRVLSSEIDIWHVHWPEGIMQYPKMVSIAVELCLRFVTLLARLRGTKIVWTAHNLMSHDQLYPRREQRFMSWFVTCLDGVISLTKVGLQLVGDRYPGIQKKPSRVICHGHYRDIYSQSISREAARKILGIDANSAVILFFGQIRPYKGVVGLVEAFREIQMPGVELVIAGRIKNAELAKEIESASAEDPRVRVYDQFVPETKVSQFFSAADLVVLPYTEILNSGSAILALSLDRPVLVPDLGSMRELRSLVGDQWIRTFNGKLTAGELLDAISWATSNAERNQKPVLTEWKDIARETKEFFEMILANG